MNNIRSNNLKEWCIENNRQELIEQWSHKNNKPMEEYSYGSNDIVFWVQHYDDPKTGKHFDFEWKQNIKDRTTRGRGCPYLAGKAILVGFNDLKTWCIENNRQELTEQWSPKNKNPMEEYSYGSREKVIWVQHYDDPKTGKHFDFEWEQVIKARTILGNGCPYLAGKATWVGFNDLVSTFPELVHEWHPFKNGDKQPCDYSYASHDKIWWHKTYFDPITHKMAYFEWEQVIRDRTMKNCGCPYLSGSYMERFTYDYLRRHKINFKVEHKVNSLGNKRFDIFIPDMNKIIELDGIQHFTDSKQFFETGATPFEKRVQNDRLKNTYCKEHRIGLLRIPYLFGNKIDTFTKILDDFVLNNTINVAIVDFYNKFDFSNYLK